jgi:HEAT repeat protein
LGQTRESGTPDALLGLARADADDQVRAEALYWYAVLAPNPAAQVIGILERDAATQVRSRGVAGLLRRPAADAVPNLITLARQSQDAGLRKEIVRSLGRSADPRAVAFMEELVKR